MLYPQVYPHEYRTSVLDRLHAGQTRPGRSYPLLVSYATLPPLPTPVRKVGAPLAAIIGLGTLAALILSLLTAVNPGGTVLGFGLATASMALVVACYLWLDRWEPEPPRLLVLAFLWGASIAVLGSGGLKSNSSAGLGGIIGLAAGYGGCLLAFGNARTLGW